MSPRPHVRRTYDLAVEDLHWLAGFLEGEGCFYIRRCRGYEYPTITASTTDKDVGERAARLIQAPVPIANIPPSHQAHFKPRYNSAVQGVGIKPLLELLYPLMGVRRRSAIRILLRTIDRIDVAKTPARKPKAAKSK